MMNTLSDFIPGRLLLIETPGRAVDPLLELAARLAHRGPLLVLDGGNCFNVHAFVRRLGVAAHEANAILERVRVARAFTCYQMAALLAQTPAEAAPILTLELLTTFYDETIAQDERERLLGQCLSGLKWLSAHTPWVVVGIRLPGNTLPGQHKLLDRLEAAADQIWRFAGIEIQSPPSLL